MTKERLYKMCVRCNGTGEVKIIIGYDHGVPIYETETCGNCKGEKELLWGSIKKD